MVARVSLHNLLVPLSAAEQTATGTLVAPIAADAPIFLPFLRQEQACSPVTTSPQPREAGPCPDYKGPL